MPYYCHGTEFSPNYSFVFDLGEKGDAFARWLHDFWIKDVKMVIPEEVRPSVAIQKNNTKIKHDIIFASYLPFVSSDFKNIVECLEPNKHYFYEIELYDKNGNKTEKYYIMHITEKLDCIIIEKSSIILSEYSKGRVAYSFNSKNDYRTIKSEIVRGHKIWIDSLFPKHIYISDDFYHEYVRRKITGISEFFPARLDIDDHST